MIPVETIALFFAAAVALSLAPGWQSRLAIFGQPLLKLFSNLGNNNAGMTASTTWPPRHF